MDSLARQSAAERQLYFTEAAARLGLSPQIVEKDFWVCWTLKRLFALPEFGPHLTFKGGTSLSKAYRLIERFSEDIDVSLQRDWLGFGSDETSPDAPHLTGKESKRRLEELAQSASETITHRLQPALQAVMAEHLGDGPSWSLVAKPDDPQTLLFAYPASYSEALAYIAPQVKIELGVRSDHWPAELRELTPYLAEAIPKAFTAPTCSVRVLSAERTFWEKATLLHALAHLPAEKPLPLRHSRHYYDLARLIDGGVGEKAAQDLSLLERVIAHKSIYFRSAWASYHTAVPGTLRLIPSDDRLSEWKKDYAAMLPMFFRPPPTFDEILTTIGGFARSFNGG